MPLYEYAPDCGRCVQCGGRFEVLQAVSEASLTQCPSCQEPCHRVLSGFAAPKSSGDLLSPSNLERKGFTQYKKTEEGRYVKTLGEGPDLLSTE